MVQKQPPEFSLVYCSFLRIAPFRKRKIRNVLTPYYFPGKINQSCVYFPSLVYVEVRSICTGTWAP